MAKSTKRVSITPLGDKVLIRPFDKANEAKTEAGIILPGKSGEEKQEKGEVIAVGKGRIAPDGKRIPMDVTVGDKVVFVRGYDYQEMTIDGEAYILTAESNVLGITN